MLLRPYRETQQTFQAVAGIDVPSWRSWAMCVTSVGSTVVGMVPALRALALVLFELLSLLIVLCLWRLEALLVLRRWFCILGFYSASIPILSLLFIFSSFSVSPSVPPSVTAASAPPHFSYSGSFISCFYSVNSFPLPSCSWILLSVCWLSCFSSAEPCPPPVSTLLVSPLSINSSAFFFLFVRLFVVLPGLLVWVFNAAPLPCKCRLFILDWFCHFGFVTSAGQAINF